MQGLLENFIKLRIKARGLISRTVLFSILFASVVLPTYSHGDLQAQESGRWRIFLEWQPVQHAFGYIVQIKDSSDKVIDMRMVQASNRLALELPPGAYFHRITALNIFRKESGWSAWKPFQVSKQRTKNRIATGLVDNSRDLPVKKRTVSRRGKTPLWKQLIPGLPDLDEGRTLRGYTYMSLAGLAAFTGLFALNRNNSLAGSSDGFSSIYTDSTTYLALRDQLLAQPSLQSVALIARENSVRDLAEYNRNRKLQTGAAVLGIVVYFLHLRNQFWSSERISRKNVSDPPKISVSLQAVTQEDRGARLSVHFRY